MKNIKWLQEFAEKQNAKKQAKKATASKKPVQLNEDEFEDGMMIIVNNKKLANAAIGSKVRYKNNLWTLVKSNYHDSKGYGSILKRIGAIDTKPLTSPEQRAFTDPGNVYDYNVRETSEVPEMRETADQTAQEIARENAVDHCTTPNARTIESPLVSTPSAEPVAPVVEEAPADEAVVEEEAPVAEEAPAEEVVEETVEEEAPTEEVAEEPTEEEAPAEEDNFTFDDVDAEPVEAPAEEVAEEEAPAEETEEEDEEKKAVTAMAKNRIIAAMLKGKK